ncbi:MAG TPA: pirin family protein [Actinomycetes bacterium]|nr:pirin family protein [Actinomycetes bacterium]
MSNLERDPQETATASTATLEPTRELLTPREVPLGGPRAMLVRRTLPHRDRRTVGAWCFVDHYGPDDVSRTAGMRVPPHPHTGLQTVSWLLEGEVLHHDSVGSEATIRPGELNLMTSGRGIAHSEQSPPERPPSLHGVQLWVALPDASRHQAPHFERHATLPVLREPGMTATVIAGTLGGTVSPAQMYSPIVGADLALDADVTGHVPLEPAFEHAVLAMSGDVQVDGVEVPVGSLLYLGCGRSDLAVTAPGPGPARALLLGGEPFEEELVMWWNFVGRDHDEIAAARADWEAHRRFGEVHGYPGDRLAAPALPTSRLKPRPRSRG